MNNTINSQGKIPGIRNCHRKKNPILFPSIILHRTSYTASQLACIFCDITPRRLKFNFYFHFFGSNPPPTFDPLRNVFCTSKRYIVPAFYESFSRLFSGIFALFSPRITHLTALGKNQRTRRRRWIRLRDENAKKK